MEMKRMNSIFKFWLAVAALMSVMLFSCQDNTINETTRIEKLPPYKYLDLDGVFNVYLVQDTAFYIKIASIGDSPENISVSIENETLFLTDHTKNKWLNPETNKINLFVHADKLNSIYAHATCNFETVNPIISEQFSLIMGGETKLMEGRLELNCKNFVYWNSHLCGGKLTLTGNVDNLAVYTFSTAAVDASNLVSSQAHIENNSKGDTRIFVKNKLEYSIRGTGNIYLRGNPPEIVLDEKTSSGELIIQF